MDIIEHLNHMSVAAKELAEDLKRASRGNQAKSLKPQTKIYKDKKELLKAKDDPLQEILEDGIKKMFGGI